MTKKAIILVSGGVDSSTVLSMICKDFDEIYAISFNYDQRHNIELSKVKEIVKDYRVKEHKVINIDLRSFGGSALTDDSIEVPEYSNTEDIPEEVPVSYVPARNTIFLSYALAYAEVKGAYDIFVGVHSTDHSNYPDCRKEYIESFEKMANLATEAGITGNKINIHAPIIDKSKAEIVAIGLKSGVDYSKTISCYNPVVSKGQNGENDVLSCGKCLACVVRLEAFAKNGSTDPIKYVKSAHQKP